MCCYDYTICVAVIVRILQIYTEGEKNASLTAIITYYHIYYHNSMSRHNHKYNKGTGTCSIEAESLFLELSDFGL